MRQKIANVLSLFTSTGTLICCALPAFLVALGAGAAVASAFSSVPILGALSRQKEWAFLMAGIMIALNFVLVYRPAGKAACTVGGGQACEDASTLNKVLLWLSAGLFVIALFMAYAALPLVQWLEAG